MYFVKKSIDGVACRYVVRRSRRSSAFTIVELIVVILVIGILTAMVAVSYNASLTDSREESMKSDLTATHSKLAAYKNTHGEYPQTLGSDAVVGDGTSFDYKTNGTSSGFCLTAARGDIKDTLYIDSNGVATKGSCSLPSVYYMQNVTSSTCAMSRVAAVDARDNHTYWIYHLENDKCWMLTNLSYAGGGSNTYGDVKTVSNGSSDSSLTYTDAKYYIPSDANPSASPADPTTRTDGGGQYGYLYNWCAAMGAQTGTGACSSSASAPAPSLSTSICPSGWRLPTKTDLDSFAVGGLNPSGNATVSDMQTVWMTQYAGYWDGSSNQGVGGFGYYWSSTLNTSDGTQAINLFTSKLLAAGRMVGVKNTGRSIRCVTI